MRTLRDRGAKPNKHPITRNQHDTLKHLIASFPPKIGGTEGGKKSVPTGNKHPHPTITLPNVKRGNPLPLSILMAITTVGDCRAPLFIFKSQDAGIGWLNVFPLIIGSQ